MSESGRSQTSAASWPGGGEQGQLLEGGNLNRVERLSDGTVRRTISDATPDIHKLLRFLERRDFELAPRALGVDSAGREVLTDLGPDGWPATVRSALADDTLAEVGAMLRRLHELTAAYVTDLSAQSPPVAWLIMEDAPRAGPVICHNDVSPWNLVFTGTTLTGLADWDLAAPGPPLWDVAYAAWTFTLMDIPEHDVPASSMEQRAGRLRLLCDSYGLNRAERFELLNLIVPRQLCAATTIERLGRAGVSGWQSLYEGGQNEAARSDAAWTLRHQVALREQLAT